MYNRLLVSLLPAAAASTNSTSVLWDVQPSQCAYQLSEPYGPNWADILTDSNPSVVMDVNVIFAGAILTLPAPSFTDKASIETSTLLSSSTADRFLRLSGSCPYDIPSTTTSNRSATANSAKESTSMTETRTTTPTPSVASTPLPRTTSESQPSFDVYPQNSQDCLSESYKASGCAASTRKELNQCLCGNGGNFVIRSARCLGKKDNENIDYVFSKMSEMCAESGTPLAVEEKIFVAAACDAADNKFCSSSTATSPPGTGNYSLTSAIGTFSASSIASNSAFDSTTSVPMSTNSESSSPTSSLTSSPTPNPAPSPKPIGLMGDICNSCSLIAGSNSKFSCQCSGTPVDGDLNEHVLNYHATLTPSAGSVLAAAFAIGLTNNNQWRFFGVL
jgi:hypothetical protein